MREMKTHEIIFEKMKGILWPVAVRPCAWLKAGCACRPGSDPFPWTQTKASLHLRPIGIWGQRSPACAPTPVQCKMFSGIPGLHPLHANSTPPPPKCLQTQRTQPYMASHLHRLSLSLGSLSRLSQLSWDTLQETRAAQDYQAPSSTAEPHA